MSESTSPRGPVQALKEAMEWFRKEKDFTPDKVAETMGYRIVESRMFQARITALRALGKYVEAETKGNTPEDKLENLRQKMVFVGVVLDEAAIPYLEASDDKNIATILNTYQRSRGLLMEYIIKTRAILQLRGSEDNARHTYTPEEGEHFRPIGRFVDKSNLVDFLIGFVERNVFPRWLQIKNISFKGKHIKPDWVSGMMMPQTKGYRSTTMTDPRPTFTGENGFPPKHTQSQNWGEPRTKAREEE